MGRFVKMRVCYEALEEVTRRGFAAIPRPVGTRTECEVHVDKHHVTLYV